MNCRMASSVCGEVGLFAIDEEEARDGVVETAEAESGLGVPPTPVVEDDGGCGGWWRRRKRAPEPVRKAET